MRVFVSIDMEGVAGLAHLQQVMNGAPDYPESRRLMTEEANAAIAGAFDGGGTAVVVGDSHGTMYNLLTELLDPRAEAVIGSPKTYSMMAGLEADTGVCLFVGYHAAAGTQAAVLDHTYSGRAIYACRVNGDAWTEADLNAALAGAMGIPVGLITGDDKACAAISERLPWVVPVVVKQGMGRNAARSLHPSEARVRIRDGATRAVRAAIAGRLTPFRLPPPFDMEADLANTGCADLCVLAPGTERVGARTVRFRTNDFAEAYRCLLAWTYLADSQAPRYPTG
jgi:D-amino peptidase